MSNDLIDAIKNSKGLDYYILAFAIETNDNGETIKKLNEEIKPIIEKYESEKEGAATDCMVRAARVPTVVYSLVGGLPGVLVKTGKELAKERGEDEGED